MAAKPIEFALTLTPRSRYDAIDVAAAIRQEFGDVLAGFARATGRSMPNLRRRFTARLAGASRLGLRFP